MLTGCSLKKLLAFCQNFQSVLLPSFSQAWALQQVRHGLLTLRSQQEMCSISFVCWPCFGYRCIVRYCLSAHSTGNCRRCGGVRRRGSAATVPSFLSFVLILCSACKTGVVVRVFDKQASPTTLCI
ncbi:hypothetical protein TRVL_07872 [Trypanosoma vivax]|nr:hypothetical protein TRVL_07872 [Trypanosoma vivax]